MKIKDGLKLKEIAGEYIVIPLGSLSEKMNVTITLNETGKDIWKSLEENKSKEEIVKLILEKYDVSEEKAQQDVQNFINQMIEKGFIEK